MLYRDASRAGRWARLLQGPEISNYIEGGVNACHVDYVYDPYESRDSHVPGTE